MDSSFDLESVVHGRVGTTVVGKYRLDRVLGIGGMAAVYAATHRNQAEFAVKMLHPDVSAREEVRSRFLREGYIANSVKHPGAVRVVDDDVAEDGAAFLVMELLDGISAEDLWFECERRIPLRAAISIGYQLLDVLAAAHAKSIVHRDIKPANLFITRMGDLKVLDFGIARLRDASGAHPATQAGAMLGTPAFMAPEQARGQTKDVDGRTDLWAVGATLFSIISGKLVHDDAESATALLLRAATTPAPQLVTVDPEVPAPIARVIDKALAFDRPARWADAATMRDALKEACIEALGEPPSRDKLAEFIAALGSKEEAPADPPPKAAEEDLPHRDSKVSTKVEGKGQPKDAADGSGSDAASEAAAATKDGGTQAPETTKTGEAPKATESSPEADASRASEPKKPAAAPQAKIAKTMLLDSSGPSRTLPIGQKTVIPTDLKTETGRQPSSPAASELVPGFSRAPAAPSVVPSPTSSSGPITVPAVPAAKRTSYVPLAVGIVILAGVLVALAVWMTGK